MKNDLYFYNYQRLLITKRAEIYRVGKSILKGPK